MRKRAVIVDDQHVRIVVLGNDKQEDKTIVVDTADYEKIRRYKWRVGTSNYVITRNAEDTVFLHRLLLGLPKGRTPQVDHIDGNPLNNTRANLRVVTQSENLQNIHRVRSATGYRNVCFHKQKGKFTVNVMVNGKTRHLGLFTTAEEAHAVVSAWRAEHMPFSQDAMQKA